MDTAKRSRIGGGKSGINDTIRRGLLDATLDIMDQGDEVSVANVAKAASVSTATAYRYFADPASLMIAAFKDRQITERDNLVKILEVRFETTLNVEDRVLMVHEAIFSRIRRSERSSRLFLAKSIESRVIAGDKAPDLRGVGRPKLFEMALEPLKTEIGENLLADIAVSLSVSSGLESYIVLKDLCQLSEQEIDRVTQSNLRAILTAGLAKSVASSPQA